MCSFKLRVLLTLFLLALYTQKNAAEVEEYEFIEKYGNSNETSGVWQAVRDISSDSEKLMKLAKVAHNSTLMPEKDEVLWATLDTTSKYLSFHNYNASKGVIYQPMLIDVVTYAIQRLPKSLFYFTKGVRDDSVLYLIPWDDTFRVVLEYGGVPVPS